MSTTNADRASAIFAALDAKSTFSGLTTGEIAQVKQSLLDIFGADLAYLVGHVTVQPTALVNPKGAGVLVSPTSGSGQVIQPTAIGGTGTIT